MVVVTAIDGGGDCFHLGHPSTGQACACLPAAHCPRIQTSRPKACLARAEHAAGLFAQVGAILPATSDPSLSRDELSRTGRAQVHRHRFPSLCSERGGLLARRGGLRERGKARTTKTATPPLKKQGATLP